jgi:hypothetical protein
MSQTKTCSCCKELKQTTEFSKQSRAKDKLQAWCKQCLTIRSNEHNLATDTGSIYKITNQEGFSYIGKTFKKPRVRFTMHKSSCKNGHKYRGETAPLLYASFRKYGIDTHTFEVINEYPNITEEALREIESNLIKAYKTNNKSLNINK